jgi:uncharacterized protein with NAD-binding domain and iron-sulfur cluster
MSKPTKVAVLGGGVSAMTTAFELTRPELAGQYEVTVYQLGWRVGGKGASGRNPAIAQRIEEHGLHIWMGFYDNAFDVMKAAYTELGRTTGPLQTWQDAFKKHSYIVLGEPLGGKEYFWQVDMPTNDETPGTAGDEPGVAEATARLAEWLEDHWWRAWRAGVPKKCEEGAAAVSIPARTEQLVAQAGELARARGGVRRGALAGGTARPSLAEADARDGAAGAFARARILTAGIAQGESAPNAEVTAATIALLKGGMASARAQLGEEVDIDFTLFQIWVGLNLASAGLIGILTDDIIVKGWDSIDGLDLRAWLGKYGADSLTLNSGPIRGVYDLAFCYVGGDIKNPQFAAGTAMRGMLRMVFDYKGAIFYKMQAGMGDTVFTPLYQVLQRRGVQFKFFHRVEDVCVDVAGDRIGSIVLSEQVKLAVPKYDPLVCVRGLPCWPSEPRYGQIASGEELQASGINLESTWAPPWKDATEKTLTLGVDFDLVVFGISLGALEEAAPSLHRASPALQRAFKHIKTVQTCAFQLWLKPDLAALGWCDPPPITERPVLGAFVEPLDTWADMSQLLVRETWPPQHEPRNVAYFCGVFRQYGPLPPPSDHAFPARELARLDEKAKAFLDEDIRILWPAAAGPGGFDWDLLVDLKNQVGERRFDSQFRRVNIDPTERYVLSVPGSTQYRLDPNGTEFRNLYLTGDWIRCGLNAGCVEAAVTAGLRTAQAITRLERPICGSRDVTRTRERD